MAELMSVMDFVRNEVPYGSVIRLDKVEIDGYTIDVVATVVFPVDFGKVEIRIDHNE